MFRQRNEIIFGKAGVERLEKSTVSIFGLGGVGAAAAMDLIRAGVGRLRITDFDTVAESNLNRLVIGFSDTVGRNKVDLLRDFGMKINPSLEIESSDQFMTGDSAGDHISADSDFYVDAIDSLNPKVNLIVELIDAGFPFISSMGTGGRMDPSKLQIGDIWKTDRCPLAAVIRKRLRKRGVRAKFPVVFSTETPVPPVESSEPNHDGMGRVRKTQGSAPFVPQAAGHFIASYVTRKLLEKTR